VRSHLHTALENARLEIKVKFDRSPLVRFNLTRSIELPFQRHY
jgi:hypothetical protein